MELPDGRPIVLADGILAEPTGPGGRIVLWLPRGLAGGFRHWERVGTAAHAGIVEGRGVRSVAASSVPARQWAGGRVGGLLHRLRGSGADRRLELPGGATVERCGPRRPGLALAWAADEDSPVDEAGIRSRWGDGCVAREVGPGLYLVSGEGGTRPLPESDATPLDRDSPLLVAGRAVAEARRAGDARGEITALADLALARSRGGDAGRAGALLEGALVVARRIGDRGGEADLLSDLGLVALKAGRPDDARRALAAALAAIPPSGGRHAEKLALDRLGRAHAALGDHAGALPPLERSLAFAVDLGDLPHQADLLWRIGIEHAELGRRDLAIARAGAAVDLMARLGRPQAPWYAHHLTEFRAAGPVPGPHLAGSIDAHPTPSRGAGGPGPLRMALTAAGSMAKFLGSGFRTATPEARLARAEACARCEHHTGLRCRACGCFTAAKARLHHERCPLGRWRG